MSGIKGQLGRTELPSPSYPSRTLSVLGPGLAYDGSRLTFDVAWADARYGGGSGGVTAYVHTQSTPATTWTINHNLGRLPQVEVFSVGGVQMFGDVTHVSDNQTTIDFNTALAGTARLI